MTNASKEGGKTGQVLEKKNKNKKQIQHKQQTYYKTSITQENMNMYRLRHNIQGISPFGS